jgi:methyltransferase OMS1, mitochondrial
MVSLTSPSLEARALSSVEAEARYDEYAASYDDLDGGDLSRALGIDSARHRTTSLASGHVLEVGVGTGLNLRYYDPVKLLSLTLVDVSDGMLRQAEARAASLDNLRGIPVVAYKADATNDLVRLFGDGRFDTVVDTFSLCVMGETGARKCLEQMGRVVKPGEGGRVLLLENARSSNPLLGLYQDATAEAAAGAGGKGCVYNQNVSELIRSSGALEIEREDQYAAGLFRSYVCTSKPLRTGA